MDYDDKERDLTFTEEVTYTVLGVAMTLLVVLAGCSVYTFIIS